MSTPPERPDEVPLPLAAELAAIPARTLRNWIASGKLAAKRGQRGWLVRMRDIERIAIMIGHPVATARPAAGMAGPLAADEGAGPGVEPSPVAVAANSGQPAASAAMVAADRQADAEAQLQRLLAPFIAELGAVREELGHVKAERDGQAAMVEELRRRAEVAEAELAGARRRLAEVSVPAVVVVARQEGIEGPHATETTSTAHRPVQGWWWRLRRVLRRG